MSSERRTSAERRRAAPWYRMDAAFMSDAQIVDLGAECGPAGPLVFVALMGAAKLQDEDGTLKMGWVQLARHAFLDDSDQARKVVAVLVDVGLIRMVEDSPRAFTAVIEDWSVYQRPADPTGARRQKRYRDRKTIPTSGHPEPPNDRYAPVTGLPVTARNGPTETETETTTSPPAVVVAGAAEGEGFDHAVLHPQLADVLAILEAAPNVHVEPAAVESALRAFPTADGVRAAHEVASFAHEGGLSVDSANRLLMAQLRKQTEPRDHTARRRPPAPSGAGPVGEEQALFDRTRRELAQAHPSSDEEIHFA